MDDKITLKERMAQLRSKYEVKIPNSNYVVAMIDGRSFSHYIKNKYDKPFDRNFIDLMDQTACAIGKDFPTMVFAYVQSDEITCLFKPTDQPMFSNRLSKLSSLIPSCASNAYNKGEINNIIKNSQEDPHILQKISNFKPKQFDCKIFSCSDIIDVYSFILWRQIDCIRNSKQQTAQTYLPHRILKNKDTNQQIQLLLSKKNIDWNSFDDDLKYGRFIYKEQKTFHSEKYNLDFTRGIFKIHPGYEISSEEGREQFLTLITNLTEQKNE